MINAFHISLFFSISELLKILGCIFVSASSLSFTGSYPLFRRINCKILPSNLLKCGCNSNDLEV